MFGTEDKAQRGSLLIWTTKTAAAVAVLAFFASTWLAGTGLDTGALSRLAASNPYAADDPVTTGSIAKGASSTKLDPCSLPPRRP